MKIRPLNLTWLAGLSLALGLFASPRLARGQTPISCGQTISSAITASGAVSNYVFTGTAGQVVLIAFSWGCYNGGEVDIYYPGANLGGAPSAKLTAGCSGNELTLKLPGSGAYTLLVHETGYNGANDFTLSIQSVTGGGCNPKPITCGQTVTAATTNSTQMDVYDYTGTAGQVVLLAFSWGCYNGGQVDIYYPGASAPSNSITAGCSGNELNLTLPVSGTYTLVVHETGYNGANSYSMSVQSVTDGGCNPKPITCGETVTASTTYSTEMDVYDYTGTAGQVVLFAFSWGCYNGGQVDIYYPGASAPSKTVTAGCSGNELNLTLPVSGTYTLIVHETGYNGANSYSMSVQSVTDGGCNPKPITCGETVTASTTYSTEMDVYDYTGSAGQVVLFAFSWGCYNGGQVDIYYPGAGAPSKTVTAGCSGNELTVTLPVSGTYTLVVHETGYNGANSYSMSVQSVTAGGCNPQPVAAGQTVSSQTTFSTEMDPFNYFGNAGEVMLFAFSWGCYNGGQMDIYYPGASAPSNTVAAGCNGNELTLTLPATGLYTLMVHETGYNGANSYSFTLTSLNHPSVSVAASTPVASDCGPTPGVFTVTRSGPTNGSLTNYYSLGGTASNGVDYSTLSSPVVIPAGASSATVTVTPILYSTANSSSTVVLNLATNQFYNLGSPHSSSVTISQSSPPTLSHSPANPGGGTGNAISITNTVISTCVPSSEFVFSNVSSPAGAIINPATGVLTWTPQTAGTFNFTVAAYDANAPGYAVTNSFQVVVSNSTPSIAISATTPNASDFPLSNGALTVTRSGATGGALAVYYTLGGTASNGVDFVAVPGELIIPAGSSSGVVVITPILYAGTGASRSVVLSLSANASYNLGSPAAATVTIAQIPPPTLTTPASLRTAIGSTLAVTNVVTSQYVPANEFLFALVSAPNGAVLNPVTGVLTWTPTNTGTFTSVIGAYDKNAPAFGATNSFTITVTNNGATLVGIGVYNTGLTSGFTPLTEGGTDPHYTIISAPAAAPAPPFTPYVVETNGYPFIGTAAAWLPNDATSQWIGVQANYYNFGQDPVGDYDYRTAFDLTGLNSATAILTIQFTVDNILEKVLLNGVNANLNLPANPNSETWYGLFEITNGFAPGTNTLDFIVRNLQPDGGNPSGLRVEISGTAWTIPGLPVITNPPASQTNLVGGAVTFAVGATGAPPLSYQWYFDGNAIPGATNSVYHIPGVQAFNEGAYSVTVTNDFGVATATATLTVAIPPSVSVSPANASIFEGGTASFFATATGTAPFAYQWMFEGATIPGATNAALVLTEVQPSAAGGYSVVVTNLAGAVTNSGNAMLDVRIFASTHSSPGYSSPGTCTITCQIARASDQSLLFLLVEPVLPAGWSLLGATGQGDPRVENGKISFNESTAPNPLTFSYTVAVPAGQTGPQGILDNVLYFLSDMTATANDQATPSPLIVNPGATLGLSIHGDQLSLSLFGNSGVTYLLQTSPDLVAWTTVTTIIPVNGLGQVNLPITGGRMFYRAGPGN